MVIYDLSCENDHSFEGWFANPANYSEQLSQRQIACPVCTSTVITKLPHTCAVHMKKEEPSGPTKPRSTPATPEQVKEALFRAHSYIRTNFEDVGSTFAEEARRIHAGNAEERPIHGTATTDERESLDHDEVPYMILPKPDLDS